MCRTRSETQIVGFVTYRLRLDHSQLIKIGFQESLEIKQAYGTQGFCADIFSSISFFLHENVSFIMIDRELCISKLHLLRFVQDVNEFVSLKHIFFRQDLLINICCYLFCWFLVMNLAGDHERIFIGTESIKSCMHINIGVQLTCCYRVFKSCIGEMAFCISSFVLFLFVSYLTYSPSLLLDVLNLFKFDNLGNVM